MFTVRCWMLEKKKENKKGRRLQRLRAKSTANKNINTCNIYERTEVADP